jgi:hypothetical protein
VAALRDGSAPELESFGIEADAMNGIADCKDCHDLATRVKTASVQKACLECHDGDEYRDMVAQWKKEVATLAAAVPNTDAQARKLIGLLRASGPLHNMEATRKILKALAERPPAAAETTASAH